MRWDPSSPKSCSACRHEFATRVSGCRGRHNARRATAWGLCSAGPQRALAGRGRDSGRPWADERGVRRNLPLGWARRPRRQRFRPPATAARLRLRPHLDRSRWAEGARVGGRRRGPGDRGRAGRSVPGLDYNGRVPGPTLRATEGDLLRMRFVNRSEHPHTMHFHGIHRPRWTACRCSARGQIAPGEAVHLYEFDAEPFGLHLYHCHVVPAGGAHRQGPLRRVHRRSEGRPRPPADELVMVHERLRHQLRRARNEFYAVNSIPFAYMDEPIGSRRGELVRIYLVNILEYDLDQLASTCTATSSTTTRPARRSSPASTPTRSCQCQGQRGILEMRFPHPGQYMFHAHQTEFAELGWMGFFESSRTGCRDRRRRAIHRRGRIGRCWRWLLGCASLSSRWCSAAFVAFGGAWLAERPGPPVEELAIERTVLGPGAIELTVRNDGPDPVHDRAGVRQRRLRRFRAPRADRPTRARIPCSFSYPWIEGEAYEVRCSPRPAPTIDTRDPGRRGDAGAGLPVLRADGAARHLRRRHPGRAGHALAALSSGAQPRRGPGVAGPYRRPARASSPSTPRSRARDRRPRRSARVRRRRRSYCSGPRSRSSCSTAIDRVLDRRRAKAEQPAPTGGALALLIAIGIGLHNLGEGLAIGSAYAMGALAVGAALVVGFALHNTTEGLAIVAPLADQRPPISSLIAPRRRRRSARRSSARSSAQRSTTPHWPPCCSASASARSSRSSARSRQHFAITPAVCSIPPS